MTSPSTTDDTTTLQCMEIWGGNESIQRRVEVPGLDIWAYCQPQGSARGGDVVWVSSCGHGEIARLVVADVSGHGQSADEVATTLRGLMRKHINAVDQTLFARELNRALTLDEEHARFATAVLATYFGPTDHLIVCNAGGPRPILRRAASGAWEFLDEESTQEAPHNVPLGVIEETDYLQFAVRLEPDDVVVIHTDWLTELRGEDGRMLGAEGVRELLASLDGAPWGTIGEEVCRIAEERAGPVAAADDRTLVVLHHNGKPAPPRSLIDSLKVMAKMIGLLDV